MSLPPGFLDELRDRSSIAQVAGRKVTWDPRRSNPGKGDYWSPCPFHQEKTASFHVDDRKGFYKCFGCDEKGDVFGFVQKTENVGFMEAVEILAREAGMQMPARDPAAAQRAEARDTLAEVMEQAVKLYRLHLSTSAARDARAYLEQRGLDAEACARHEIGFAPDARTFATQALVDKGISIDKIVEAGIAIRPDNGGTPYDRFRGRIMFPIRDARGRAIAFGGRAMDPNARAKYLNSNETPLFDKGRALYNIGPAREASGKTGRLIVAEGYMDVIALAEHGFPDTVAPLGTAITEDQLKLMWRIADEPVITLDGDTAGQRAAMRLVDLALPLLQAGKSLRFCVLPQGLDPDDLLRAQGRNAMEKLLNSAEPMVSLLWRRETEGKVFDSPERRAALDASLRQALGKIEDPSIRDHYRAAIRDLRNTLFAPQRAPRQNTPFRRGAPAHPMPLSTTRASILAQAGNDALAAARVRESAILLGCINHASVALMFETRLERMKFLCPDLESIRTTLLQVIEDGLDATQSEDADKAAGLPARIVSALGHDPREKLLSIGQVRANRHLLPSASAEDAAAVVREEIEKQNAVLAVEEEVQDAMTEIAGAADEGLTWRVSEVGRARDAVIRQTLTEAEGTADDSANLSDQLQQLIDKQVWIKKKR